MDIIIEHSITNNIINYNFNLNIYLEISLNINIKMIDNNNILRTYRE